MINLFAILWAPGITVFFMAFNGARGPRTVYNSPVIWWMRNEHFYKIYLKYRAYSDEEFYTKLHCLNTLSQDVYDRIEKYDTLMHRRLTLEQRHILIRDMFDQDFTCPWGGTHVRFAYYGATDYDEIRAGWSDEEENWITIWLPVLSHRLAEKHENFINLDSLNLLFSFDSANTIPLLETLGSFQTWNNKFWVKWAPREAFNEFVLRLVVAGNQVLEEGTSIEKKMNVQLAGIGAAPHRFPDKNKDILEKMLPFVRQYVLSKERTHEEIYMLAQLPYQWLADILFESSLMFEEDKVMSILIINSQVR